MRIGLAQINPILGQFKANRERILTFVERAVSEGCNLVVFPEAALFGYHPFDLLERPALVRQQLRELKTIQKNLPKQVAILLGALQETGQARGRPYRNSAVLLQKEKSRWFDKTLLPTGDVFDEARFIEPGTMGKNYFDFQGKKFFVTICEDIWAWPNQKGQSQYRTNPIGDMKKQKVDCVFNLSASPFFPKKLKRREELVRQTARSFRAPMIYCNLVGAQDEIIFDGQSFAVDRTGNKILELSAFEEDLGVFNLKKLPEKQSPRKIKRSSEIQEIRNALVLGVRDFCRKTKQSRVHVGLSGGIDSAVVLCLAAEALGSENVHAIALPTHFNHVDSLKLAKQLAQNLSVSFTEFPIQNSYEVLKTEIDKRFDVQKFGLVHENLQSRIRGLILMAYSNHQNSLLLGTCNKSELATGFGTLYGDMIGALLPIGDLTKEKVRALAHLYNLSQEIIPQFIIDRPPSAELSDGQLDEDRLPPYKLLDASVENIVTNGKPLRSETDRWLMKQIFLSEFKRWQSPPILKVSAHSFGRGRRWPVAHQASE